MIDIIWNCTDTSSTSQCTITNGDPFFVPFFSAGDIMVSVLIFLLVVLEIIKLLKGGINSIKTKKSVKLYEQNGKEYRYIDL